MPRIHPVWTVWVMSEVRLVKFAPLAPCPDFENRGSPSQKPARFGSVRHLFGPESHSHPAFYEENSRNVSRMQGQNTFCENKFLFIHETNHFCEVVSVGPRKYHREPLVLHVTVSFGFCPVHDT